MRTLAGLAVLVAACSDPTIDVALVYGPTTAGGAVSPLADERFHYTLSVIVIDADCDAVAYGEVSDDALAAGRRTAVNADQGARLTGVPRLGDKLLVVEATDERGVRVAGGCTRVGDIEHDITEEIVVHPALRARLLAQAMRDGTIRDPGLPLTEGETFDVFVREAYGGGGTPADVALRVQLRTPDAAPRDLGFGKSAVGEGIVRVRLDEAPPAGLVGPAELILRAPWADEVLTVPAFFRAERIGFGVLGAGGNADPRRNPNRIAPSWALDAPLDDPGQPVRAAGLSLRAGEPPPPVTLSLYVRGPAEEPVTGYLTELANLPVPSVRAIAAWRPALGDAARFVMRGTRWQQVEWAPAPRVVDLAPAATTPADELLAFPACGNATPSPGLLARVGDGPYEPYASPGQVATSGAIFDLAVELNRAIQPSVTMDASVVGTACLTAADGDLVPIAIVRLDNGTGAITTRVYGPRGLQFGVLAGSGVGTTRTQTPAGGNAWVLRGGEIGIDGPKIVAYRLVGVNGETVALPDGNVEHPLAAPPSAMVGLDLNGDDSVDSIAAVTIADRTRLQQTIGGTETRPALSGVSLGFPGQDAGLAQGWLRTGTGKPQLLLFTSEVIAAFDLTQPEAP